MNDPADLTVALSPSPTGSQYAGADRNSAGAVQGVGTLRRRMTASLIRRAARGLLVLFLVSVIVFGMGLLSGDPIKLLIPTEVTPEQLEQLRSAYGFNDPVPVRLGRFLAGLLQGDLGYSFRYQQPAFSVVAERLGATLELALAAMAVTVLVALPAGVISAVKRDSPLDAPINTGSVIGHSVPSFFVEGFFCGIKISAAFLYQAAKV